MKKIILLLCLFSLGFSTIRLQGQANLLGYGFGLGLGMQALPGIIETGIEGTLHNFPTITTKGTYKDVPYDGKINIATTRVGGYIKLNIPVIDKIPVLRLIAHPTLHAGTQSGLIDISGDVRLLGAGNIVEGKKELKGAYSMLGFPGYLGPFFIEPSFGTQHIYVPGALNIQFIDAQLALGLSF